ncbi:MAG: transcription antitermination factor NusB [Candidatus Woykebacteria bacterium RBG_13_40_7b]|uniref:Transcription antitermination protein NusB n=1 Tax=Candidatus Woykebacteria bacterium RBG_13_40_7b TaxID=1802594 RepID=A0A1G1W7P8_9BACT|nr:MAG: transcription antitermination factor NusB [Candidatus Woykebacteria bacterium RBG_13_40_7b]
MALFEWSFNSESIDTLIERDLDEYPRLINKEDAKIENELAFFIARGVTENLDTIDGIIETSAPEWPIEQIAKVDLEVLRVAVFEIYIARNVPPKVAIDEAIELAKEFGGENSSKFVNGVLGTVIKNLMPELIEQSKKI